MKKLISLLAGLATLAAAASASAQDPAPALDLSHPPTFGELSKAALKFPVPNWMGSLVRNGRNRQPGVPQPGQPQPGYYNSESTTLELSAEPASLAIRQADRQCDAISWKSIQCKFPPSEQADTGRYYPPKLPITDTSHVSTMSLRANGEVATLVKQGAAALKVLGIVDPKLDTWISNELWKNTGNFQNEYQSQVPKVSFYFSSDSNMAGEQGAVLEMKLDWSKGE
ncbi:hypothetical protein [Haloferula sp. BvORR071]|uniref:hypothetical protein n=1 Tax=Haloferula sp. BvORR071 TaxID=1396141 RepID=UPI00054D3242|nr:hypothetical protein [Haloferula sp. BvORR071]